MSRRCTLALLLSPLAALAVAAAAVAAAPPGGATTAKLSTFESPTGDAYFALSIPPVTGAQAGFDHEVVILFDTSASQTGVLRQVW